VCILAGLPVNKLFDIQRLEQKQDQFLCHPNQHPKLPGFDFQGAMISGDPMAKDIVTYVACETQDLLRMRAPRMLVVRTVY